MAFTKKMFELFMERQHHNLRALCYKVQAIYVDIGFHKGMLSHLFPF